jgi:hypothetical protein
MTYEEAIYYLDYLEKNGCNITDTTHMTKKEIIEYAKELANQGEGLYDEWKERDI